MIATIDQTVQRMKAEIVADVKLGHVPINVMSFAELHDYCDANTYGGLCEDAVADPLIEHFGGRDQDDSMPAEFIDFVNTAQGLVDQWLQASGILKETRGTLNNTE